MKCPGKLVYLDVDVLPGHIVILSPSACVKLCF